MCGFVLIMFSIPLEIPRLKSLKHQYLQVIVFTNLHEVTSVFLKKILFSLTYSSCNGRVAKWLERLTAGENIDGSSRALGS